MPTRRRLGGWKWAIPAAVLLAAGGLAVRFWLNPWGALATPRVSRYNQAFGVRAFDHRVTLLLLGSSLETAGGHDLTGKQVRNRADTIMVVSLDPKRRQVGVLSIPRDSRVDIPGVGFTKIAECTFFGGVQGCVRLIQRQFHIPIDYYAFLGMFQLPQLIDDMGGITVDVPQNERYQAGRPLGIDLHAGLQHLDGQQVLEFVRFRNTAQGDIGRIQQQQAVLKAVARKLLEPSEIPRWPALARDALRLVSASNLSVGQLLALGLSLRGIPLSAVRYGTLPGHGSVHRDPYLHQRLDYWSLDARLAPILVQNVLLGRPLTAAQRAAVRMVVESGTSQLAPARAVAAALRRKGYQVVGVGWANHHHHRRSLVVNTTGDRWLGEAVAAGLGPTVQQFTAYHTAPWDLRVVVGADYRPPVPAAG